MKKYIALFSLLLSFALPTLAGNGDEYLTLKGGFLFARTGNLQMSYERDLDYETSVELFGEVGQKFVAAAQSKDYYWDVGISYKKCIKRYKNSELRLAPEVHGGAHIKRFFFGAGVGLEYTYTTRSGVQFVVSQKNQVNFLRNGVFKNGLLIGLRIPL